MDKPELLTAEEIMHIAILRMTEAVERHELHSRDTMMKGGLIIAQVQLFKDLLWHNSQIKQLFEEIDFTIKQPPCASDSCELEDIELNSESCPCSYIKLQQLEEKYVRD